MQFYICLNWFITAFIWLWGTLPRAWERMRLRLMFLPILIIMGLFAMAGKACLKRAAALGFCIISLRVIFPFLKSIKDTPFLSAALLHGGFFIII